MLWGVPPGWALVDPVFCLHAQGLRKDHEDVKTLGAGNISWS